MIADCKLMFTNKKDLVVIKQLAPYLPQGADIKQIDNKGNIISTYTVDKGKVVSVIKDYKNYYYGCFQRSYTPKEREWGESLSKKDFVKELLVPYLFVSVPPEFPKWKDDLRSYLMDSYKLTILAPDIDEHLYTSIDIFNPVKPGPGYVEGVCGDTIKSELEILAECLLWGYKRFGKPVPNNIEIRFIDDYSAIQYRTKDKKWRIHKSSVFDSEWFSLEDFVKHCKKDTRQWLKEEGCL